MSNFNIGQFMAEFQNGFQKVNQYRCRLPVQRIGLPRNSTQVIGPLAKRILPARSFEAAARSSLGV